MEKHRNVSDTVHGHNFSLQGQIICLTLGHSAITATQVVQVGQGEASPHLFCFPSLNSSQEISSELKNVSNNYTCREGCSCDYHNTDCSM